MFASEKIKSKTAIPGSAENLKRIANDPLLFDVSTNRDQAIFWGTRNSQYDSRRFENMSSAQEFARHHGARTLELTRGGEALNHLQLFSSEGVGETKSSFGDTEIVKSAMPPSDAAIIWDTASSRYSLSASGRVSVFSDDVSRLGGFGLRTYPRSERPLLTGGLPFLVASSVKANGPDSSNNIQNFRYEVPKNSDRNWAISGQRSQRNNNVTHIYQRDNRGEIYGIEYKKEIDPSFHIDPRRGAREAPGRLETVPYNSSPTLPELKRRGPFFDYLEGRQSNESPL